MEENVGLMGFTPDGKSAYLTTSLGSDTARLVEHNLATGKEKVLAERKDVDVGGVIVHPTKFHVQAASFEHGRLEWQVIDPSIKDDFAALKKRLRRRLQHHQPRSRRQDLARRLHAGSWTGALLHVGSRVEEGDVHVLASAEARGTEAVADEGGDDQARATVSSCRST